MNLAICHKFSMKFNMDTWLSTLWLMTFTFENIMVYQHPYDNGGRWFVKPNMLQQRLDV